MYVHLKNDSNGTKVSLPLRDEGRGTQYGEERSGEWMALP